MDSLYPEASAAKLDSNREHGVCHRGLHFPFLYVTDIRGVVAWVHQSGHGSSDHEQ
jgi:hypothetical protein